MGRLIDKFGAFVGLFVLVMLLVIWGSQEPGQAQSSTSSKAVTSANDGYSEIYGKADAGLGSVNWMNSSAFDPFPIWQPLESEE